MESMEADYYNQTYTFSSDDGLNFAFGVTTLGQAIEVDPDYGQIIAQYEWWGLEGLGSWGNSRIPIKKCSQEDLGITEGTSEESRFYPINESQQEVLNFYSNVMYCFDFEKMKQSESDSRSPNRLEIQGAYSSSIGRMLKLQFQKCIQTERSTCHTDEEISNWLKYKFFVILENRSRF